jgi:hypothetical protein
MRRTADLIHSDSQVQITVLGGRIEHALVPRAAPSHGVAPSSGWSYEAGSC